MTIWRILERLASILGVLGALAALGLIGCYVRLALQLI